MDSIAPSHGGNITHEALRLGLDFDEILDASSSLVPFPAPSELITHLQQSLLLSGLRNYPDTTHFELREVIGAWHNVDPGMVMPGNGAAELFTWAARDAASLGISILLSPCFSDYVRALSCWKAAYSNFLLPIPWPDKSPQPFPLRPQGQVLWITNPHNPTGQLWSKESLTSLLEQYSLVICDEAFLPLVPEGENQSLISCVQNHSNLVVIRSLTKLFAIAGLRIGYVVGGIDRLNAWRGYRDPWPLNNLAISAGTMLMKDHSFFASWIDKVQNWVLKESLWIHKELNRLPGIIVHPSSANFFLIESKTSLINLREHMARQGILLRDCRSFEGLGECWLRIGLQERAANLRIVSEMRNFLI